MWRATVVLLLLAALSGAPSRTSAGGNGLAGPTATPASGSTLTIFTFSVRYDGNFPATTVTAAVAGLDLVMALADGSMDAGTWVASSTLPAGSWGTAFIAYAEQGNAASVTGPALTVAPADAVTPAPATPGAPVPSVPGRRIETSREAVTETVPASTPVPAPAQPISSSDDKPPVAAPSSPDATVPAIPATAGTAATAQPSVGGPAVAPGPPASAPRSAVAAGSGTSSGQTGMTRPTDAETGDRARASDPTEEETSIIVLMGLVGVGAVALIGTAVLIARRRRADDDAEPIATTAAAALRRRSVRRARLRMGEDPIMTAMGIGAEAERKVRGRPAVDEDQA